MITSLLTKINKELEELNYQLRDNEYLNDLEKRINIINESINIEHQQNIKLHSIIKEVREYILKEDEWIKNNNYKLLKTDRLLEILDKESK